jgi:hypothetical protein
LIPLLAGAGLALTFDRTAGADPASAVAMERAMELLRARIDGAIQGWKDAARQMSAAFWTARLHRERRIAAGQTGSPLQLFQAGLFDRRAVRAHRDQAEAAAERAGELRSRLAALERRSRLDFRPPALLLVLVP